MENQGNIPTPTPPATEDRPKEEIEAKLDLLAREVAKEIFIEALERGLEGMRETGMVEDMTYDLVRVKFPASSEFLTSEEFSDILAEKVDKYLDRLMNHAKKAIRAI
jgi:hypothetical protein